MGAHAAESYEVVAPTSGLSPVIRFDWSISHIETSLGHSRYLSAVVESNAATGPQYSPAVVQASLLLLGTLSVVALATVASCWGFLRRGKRKGAHAVDEEAVGESHTDLICDLSRPVSPINNTPNEQFSRPPQNQYFHLQPHSVGDQCQAAPCSTVAPHSLHSTESHPRPQSGQGPAAAAGVKGGIAEESFMDASEVMSSSLPVPGATAATSSSDSPVTATEQESSMVGPAPTFSLTPRQGYSNARDSSLDGNSLQVAAVDSFPGLVPRYSPQQFSSPVAAELLHGEHFVDARDDMSDIREEEELVLMDDSGQLKSPTSTANNFPVWPPAVGGSQAGDSGIAALSRPGSRGGTPVGSPRQLYFGADGKPLKSVLDATTKLLARPGQRTRDLQKHLEVLGSDNPVMQHFELVGTSKMRAGARSVVQFGRGIYDGYESVVRFFISIEDYHAVMEVYRNSPLTDMLPKLIAYCDNFEGVQTVKKSTGGATAAEEQDDASEKGPSADEQLPACIVMEKGECLVEYLARNKGSVMLEDQQFGLRILVDVMAAVLRMHKQGYVHGNINPAHVLWLPSEASWTLIGLSNATRTGKLLHVHSGAGLLLSYSSPELAVAMRATSDMHAMRGFASPGVTGVFSAALTGGMTGEFGKQGASNALSGGITEGGFSFPVNGSPMRADSGGADVAVTEALSIVADGVEVLAGTEMDVWAVGMLAWELLNGAPAFDLEEDDEEDIMEELCGIGALPWSDERIAPEQRTKLGFFCEPVRQLLSRNPADRMPLATFQALCHRVLFASTTMAEPSPMQQGD